MKKRYRMEVKTSLDKKNLEHLLSEIGEGVEITYLEDVLNISKERTILNFMNTIIHAFKSMAKIENIYSVGEFSKAMEALKTQAKAYDEFIEEGSLV